MADNTTTLAELIADGRSGKISQAEFARAFGQTKVLVLLANAAAPGPDSAPESDTDDDVIEPLILELPSGEPAVAVFGAPELVPDDYLQAAPNPLALQGAELLGMLPTGVGLALNPAHEHSLQLQPNEIPTFAFVALGK